MSGPFSIRIDGLGMDYPGPNGGVRALDRVSFEVRHGERVGIVGANGAGKSTLLQLLAGVSQPTAGKIEITGRVNAILAVGAGVREEATGRENLYLDGAIHGRSRADIDRNIEAMIAFADLGDFIDRPMRTYSSGMKARIGFASLAFVEPEILIVDEALAVGDAKFATKATAAMQALCNRGGILLIVSHSLEFIVQNCPRCLWLDQGRLCMDGGAAEVTRAYRQTVHAREESDLAKIFGQSGRGFARTSAFSVGAVRLTADGEEHPGMLVESGARIALHTTLRAPANARPLRVRLWIERNDGLVLIDETAPIALHTDGLQTVQIDLGRCAWRPFLYQAHIELLDADGRCAHAAKTFKIWSDRTIHGGAPMVRDALQIARKEDQ
jgi:lipopolysaccharide transport system ATP-binding protein